MKTRSPYLTFNMQDQMELLDKFDLAQIQASANLNMKLTKKQTLSVLVDSYLDVEGVDLTPNELIDTPPVEDKSDVTENNTNNSGYISPYG
tara:strand:+ start:278 stop:550 length:273 start_codon:yes stop_codon:yes gene_type:complete